MLFDILRRHGSPAFQNILSQLGEEAVHPLLRFLLHFGNAQTYLGFFAFQRACKGGAFPLNAL